jgi:hypothetical protein
MGWRFSLVQRWQSDARPEPAHVELMYQTETRGDSGNIFLKVTDDKPAK